MWLVVALVTVYHMEGERSARLASRPRSLWRRQYQTSGIWACSSLCQNLAACSQHHCGLFSISLEAYISHLFRKIRKPRIQTTFSTIKIWFRSCRQSNVDLSNHRRMDRLKIITIQIYLRVLRNRSYRAYIVTNIDWLFFFPWLGSENSNFGTWLVPPLIS